MTNTFTTAVVSQPENDCKQIEKNYCYASDEYDQSEELEKELQSYPCIPLYTYYYAYFATGVCYKFTIGLENTFTAAVITASDGCVSW